MQTSRKQISLNSFQVSRSISVCRVLRQLRGTRVSQEVREVVSAEWIRRETIRSSFRGSSEVPDREKLHVSGLRDLLRLREIRVIRAGCGLFSVCSIRRGKIRNLFLSLNAAQERPMWCQKWPKEWPEKKTIKETFKFNSAYYCTYY